MSDTIQYACAAAAAVSRAGRRGGGSTARARRIPARITSPVYVTLAALALALGATGSPAWSATLERASEIDPFVAGMVLRHGVSERDTRALLEDARVLDSVLELIQRPAERKPWHEYRKIFLTGKRIARGADFWRKHEASLSRAVEQFGVPAEVIVAIIGVESFYGVHRGRTRVLDALATLGFRYPRRAKFFRSELESFVLLAGEEKLDARQVKGSYAGAMGIAQFIPSSYRNYAVDFDGNGMRDLIESPPDAIGSIANYLAEHGWRTGSPVAVQAKVQGDAYRAIVEQGIKPHSTLASIRARGVEFAVDADDAELGALIEFETADGHQYWVGLTNFYVITRYNHSRLYALAVFQLAERIRQRHAAGGG